MKPWKILSSKQTYKDNWLSVRTDHVRLEDGREIPGYHILEYSDWVSVIGLTDEGNVVLIKEYRHGAEALTIGLPSGASEPGEDILEVAKREFEEETGYTAPEWIEIGSGYSNWAINNNKVHYFLAFGAKKTGEQQLDPNEDIEPVEWPWQKYFDQDGVAPQHCLHTAALYYAERYFKQNPDKRPA